MSKRDELTFQIKRSLVVGTATAALTASSGCIVNPGPGRPDGDTAPAPDTGAATDTSDTSDAEEPDDTSSRDSSSDDASGDSG